MPGAAFVFRRIPVSGALFYSDTSQLIVFAIDRIHNREYEPLTIRLGHEIMACAVCRVMFLISNKFNYLHV